MELQEAEVRPESLADPATGVADREFMLVDDEGRFLSQRQIPELTLVAPKVGEKAIFLTAPGVESVSIDTQRGNETGEWVHASVHGKQVGGEVVSEEVNEWFEDFLPAREGNSSYRLIRTVPQLPRFITARYLREVASNRVGFGDGFPITLATVESLIDFNKSQEDPMEIERFRMNLTIGGAKEPFDEDYWREIKVGEMNAFVARPCARCEIPDVNPEDATVGKAVRAGLAQSRRGDDITTPKGGNGVFFGQNLNHVYEPGMTIRVGDEVIVTQRDDRPNITPKTKKQQ